VHKHPLYYPVRNHIIDFLVSRSKSFARDFQGQHDSRNVPTVRPGADAPAVAADTNVVRLGGAPHGHAATH
jgi:nitrate/nitrite transport system ATP-binding protein